MHQPTRRPLVSKLLKRLVSIHHGCLHFMDKSYAYLKPLWNPYLHLYFLRTPLEVDFVQNNVLLETPRVSDHRAHLRLSPQQSPVGALPSVESRLLSKSSEEKHANHKFYYPAELHPELLEIPNLNSPSRFEELSKLVVSESKRLLLDPATFSEPKRTVQVLDFISNLICIVADAAEMVRQLHPNDRWRLSAIHAVQRVQSFIQEVNVDPVLYERLRNFDNTQNQQQDNKQRVVLTKMKNAVLEERQNRRQVASVSDSAMRPEGGPTDLDSKKLEGEEETEKAKGVTEVVKDWVDALTDEETVVLRLMREAMEQQGVHIKNKEDRERCLALLQKEQSLSTSIAQGPLTNIQEAWIPWSVLESAGVNPSQFPSRRSADGTHEVNLSADSPIANDLMRLCPFPEIRRSIWLAQQRQSSRLEKQVHELILTRQHLASLRGFQSWSVFAKREGIMKTDRAVEGFIERCLTALSDGLRHELSVLRTMKCEWNRHHCKHYKRMADGEGDKDRTVLQPWDMAFYMQKLKTDTFEETAQKVKGRLSIRTLLRFYGGLLSSLFGVVLNPCLPKDNDVWHPTVMKFQVCRKLGPHEINFTPIGTLYLDLFDRLQKPRMDAQFSIRGSRLQNFAYRYGLSNELLSYINIYKAPHLQSSTASPISSSPEDPLNVYEYRQAPCCVLVANIATKVSAAGSDDPDRLVHETFVTPNEARDLFHELGHVTHALLSKTGLQHLSGTRGSVDFTEFPSHLFEHFIMDPTALSHGLVLGPGDRALMDRYQSGVQVLGHLDAAGLALKTAVDMIAHSTPLSTLSDLASSKVYLQQYIYQRLQSLPPYNLLNQSAFNNELPIMDLIGVPQISRFDHLVHYGGMFHTYLFNRAVSSWVWSEAFRGPQFINDQEAGNRLKALLEKGSIDTSMTPILNLFPPHSREMHETIIEDPSQVPLDCWIETLRKSLPSRL